MTYLDACAANPYRVACPFGCVCQGHYKVYPNQDCQCAAPEGDAREAAWTKRMERRSALKDSMFGAVYGMDAGRSAEAQRVLSEFNQETFRLFPERFPASESAARTVRETLDAAYAQAVEVLGLPTTPEPEQEFFVGDGVRYREEDRPREVTKAILRATMNHPEGEWTYVVKGLTCTARDLTLIARAAEVRRPRG